MQMKFLKGSKNPARFYQIPFEDLFLWLGGRIPFFCGAWNSPVLPGLLNGHKIRELGAPKNSISGEVWNLRPLWSSFSLSSLYCSYKVKVRKEGEFHF